MRLLIALSILASASGFATIAQSEEKTIQLQLWKHGTLELRVPRQWKKEVDQILKTLPPTLTLKPDRDSVIMLTPIWNESGDTGFGSREFLQDFIDQSRIKARKDSIESELTVRELSGASIQGLYFSATDRAPSSTGYKYLTQAVARIDDIVVILTILTRKPESPHVGAALEMITDARLLPPQ